MKTDFEIKLLALTQDAQQAIENFMQRQEQIELFSMDDVADIDDPEIDIFAYPDFPNYDADGPLEYAAIQSLRIDGKDVYLKGVLKNNNFPETVEIHLYDLGAVCAAELADYLYERFVGE